MADYVPTSSTGKYGYGMCTVTPIRWTWADSAARLAQSVTSAELGMVGIQLDDDSAWLLYEENTPTWRNTSVGSSGITGSGTAGKLPKWFDASTLTDSIASESGSTITVGGYTAFADDTTHQADSKAAFRSKNAYIHSIADGFLDAYGSEGVRIGELNTITPTNYTEFEPDGTMVYKGNAVVWKDENFSGFEAGSAASAPDDIDWDGGPVKTKGFNGLGTEEQLFAAAELQHDYKEGTDLSFHIHWSPTTTDSGDVKWQLAYTVERSGTGTVASGSLSAIDSADGTAWVPKILSLGTVTGTDLKIGDQVGVRLYRDPTDGDDTYGADAALAFTFGYHYRVDTLGSRELFTK